MKIAMLGGHGESTNIVYNYLSGQFDIGLVIIEDKVDRKQFLKKRVKSLGFSVVFGQILFGVLIRPVLKRISRSRVNEICRDYALDTSDAYLSLEKCRKVDSVNSAKARKHLRGFEPDIVIVNGTRIIGRKTLKSTKACFINMHVGITPAYRGVHGGYWSLYKKDAGNFGVTVHFVDEGIDTGSILYQERMQPAKRDTFITYPYLQVAAGVGLEAKAIKDIMDGTVHAEPGSLPSGLYSHPTIFQYIYGLLLRKVR